MRGRAPEVPITVFVGGAFLLDFLWVGFAVTRIDLTPWSDWSHSLVMALVWASAFAAMFIGYGRVAAAAIWLIVCSHFALDLLIQGASIVPDGSDKPAIPILFAANGWTLQRVLAAMFLVIFLRDEWKARMMSWRTFAAVSLVIALSFR